MTYVRDRALLNDKIVLGWWMFGLLTFGILTIFTILIAFGTLEINNSYDNVPTLIMSISLTIFFFIEIILWGDKNAKI